MDAIELARGALCHALELQVLDPVDLPRGGVDPRAALDALRARDLLGAAAAAALERLVRRGAADEAPHGLADGPATLVVERERGATMTSPSSAARDWLVPASPGGLSLSAGACATLAPERADARAMSPGADGACATLAPERADARPMSPGAAPVRFGVATVMPGGAREALLRELDPPARRAIDDASFCRIAVRLGLLSAADVAGVAAGAPPEGLVFDRAHVEQVHAVQRGLRPVCGACLHVWSAPLVASAPCPRCGTLPSLDARPAPATVATTGGIEGFPGEGGTFAGYELLARVAEGGMGVVFRARQTKLNRVVALKVMRGGSLASKARRRRFLHEAEAAAALKHPSIVPVHEIDEVAGYPFYTMDFVEGVPLNEYVKENALDPRQIAVISRHLTAAVQHLHMNGIIHRDLKPDNILVGADGVPRIIDFGIAKRLGDESAAGGTIEGDVLGTLHYMSPEQASGRVHEVDTRTDVYALGAIIYELLTGLAAWGDLADGAFLVAIQEEDPPSICSSHPEVEQDLESIVLKAMSKDRERRYRSAEELADDLERFERHQPVQARPATLTYRLRKAIRRRLPAVVASTTALVVVAAMLGQHAAQDLVRRREVAQKIAAAADPACPPVEQEALLHGALALDPGSLEAQGRLDVLVERRLSRDRLREQEARQRQERVETELARERAEREANAAREREEARIAAARQANEAAEERARLLVERAQDEEDPLVAMAHLNDALGVLGPRTPGSPSALRARVEAAKVDLALRLAGAAVAAQEAGLTWFWLGEATRLPAIEQRTGDVDALVAELGRLSTGARDVAEASALAAAGDWIAARACVERALAAGYPPASIADVLSLTRAGCEERARVLLGEGQARLELKNAIGALASAREALRFDSAATAAAALAADCETSIHAEARRTAAELFSVPGSRTRALSELRRAEQLLSDPHLAASLLEERLARGALIRDARLAGLVFVPDVPDLGVAAHYASRHEVTAAEFLRFVADGGHADPDLRDDEGRQDADDLRRRWGPGVEEGAPTPADRPVTGVTIHEARAFARWRSRRLGGTWRLPTEAEWEVAAGWDPAAGRLRTYPWGDTFLEGAATIASDAPSGVGAAGGDVSPSGLFDAGGNALEWVERAGRSPGTKGAAFGATADAARRHAQVRSTGDPGRLPPPELLEWIGFRLVRELAGETK